MLEGCHFPCEHDKKFVRERLANGNKIKWFQSQSELCTIYKCATHKDCAWKGRVKSVASGSELYAEEANIHATEILVAEYIGIHPVWKEYVDKTRNGTFKSFK